MRPKIGMQASHEQFSPRELLTLMQQAEQAGFDNVLASDHIAPWGHVHDDSGFVWTWLGAAMQTTNLPFKAVSVPGWRYHPVILAQAIATVCHMFPGRFDPVLGSGEALNEHVVGQGWPDKPTRNQILRESVAIMRRLWNGETVTHHGAITLDQATLYTLPPTPPRVYAAALTAKTAEWAGEWADGLATTAGDMSELQERLHVFRQNGGAGKPVIIKADFSYADTYDAALDAAYQQWRYLLLPPEQLADLRTPDDFEAATRHISKDMVARNIPIFTSTDQAVEWITTLMQLNPDTIILHNVNTNQQQMITDFGARVLPKLR